MSKCISNKLSPERKSSEDQQLTATVGKLLDVCTNHSFGILGAQRGVFGLDELHDVESLLDQIENGVIEPVQVAQQLLQKNRTLERKNALVNEMRERKLASVIALERLDRLNVRGIFEDVGDTYFLVWYQCEINDEISDRLLGVLKEQSVNFGQDSFFYQRKGKRMGQYLRRFDEDGNWTGEWLDQDVGTISNLGDLENLLERSKLTAYAKRVSMGLEDRMDSLLGSAESCGSRGSWISQVSLGYVIRQITGPIEGWDGALGFFSQMASRFRDSEAERHAEVLGFLETIAQERRIPTTEFETIADQLVAKRKRLNARSRRRIARKFPLIHEG